MDRLGSGLITAVNGVPTRRPERVSPLRVRPRQLSPHPSEITERE
jgi:hypothetical protein